jgi:hypothetical protein
LKTRSQRTHHGLEHGALTEQQEERPQGGAYIPLVYADSDAVWHPDGTQETPGAENDVLRIRLKPVVPAVVGGTYSLSKLPGIEVYTDPGRTQKAPATWSASATQDVDLYIEGRQLSQSGLYVTWQNDEKIIRNADRVDITVFGWTGPTSVPNWGQFTYSGVGASPTPGESKWVEPNWTGVEKSNLQDSGGIDYQEVLWKNGPFVGQAVYQASQHFSWTYDVNIVQIKVEQPSNGAPFFYRNGQVANGPTGPDASGKLMKSVKSTDADPALGWGAKITVNGPVGGRGVSEMRVGFMQTQTQSHMRGEYATAGKWLKSDIEDAGPLNDSLNDPWFWYRPQAQDPEAASAQFLNPTPTAGGNVKDIRESDTPTAGAPLYLNQTGWRSLGDHRLTEIDAEDHFRLYVVAKTTDNRLGASWYSHATAFADWSWSGDGTVDASEVWHNNGNAAVTPPPGWTIINTVDDAIRAIAQDFRIPAGAG